MRLTKKHIRQMILREMKELNEQAGWSREAAYVPPPEQQTSMRDQMVQEIMAITVPGIPGAIYSQVEAEAMADAKIAALNAPMAGAGESTSYGAPRAGRIVREMRMAPTHAGAIEMMQANPDETVMFEPGEEVPPADAIADAVEGIQDQGLLTKIWSMIKSATMPTRELSQGTPIGGLSESREHLQEMISPEAFNLLFKLTREFINQAKASGASEEQIQGVVDAAIEQPSLPQAPLPPNPVTPDPDNPGLDPKKQNRPAFGTLQRGWLDYLKEDDKAESLNESRDTFARWNLIAGIPQKKTK